MTECPIVLGLLSGELRVVPRMLLSRHLEMTSCSRFFPNARKFG